MALSPLAGRPAPPDVLIDVDALLLAYYERVPDPSDPQQRVSFGTSGHRGTPLTGSFNEAHVLAMTQAICEHRAGMGIDGPLYIGMDTHAVSAPAQRTALEVLAANGVEVFVQRNDGFTPTPAISHAILTWNRGRLGSGATAAASARGLADGIVVTPSHNPPKDGGFKYNPPHGGPADTDVTGAIQNRANELMKSGNRDVRRIPYERALRTPTTHLHDYVEPYVADLVSVVDLDAIRAAGVRIGVDPLGGASVAYWEPIRERYGLDLTVVNPEVDPRFAFMTLDHDGQIRMDCSSPYAMTKLIGLKDRFAIAFGNDADGDRHGIVTPSVGLMNPNRYLAVAIDYLFARRSRAAAAGLGGAAAAGVSGAAAVGNRSAAAAVGNSGAAAVGKTVVSSSLIDRVTAAVGRRLVEVPVGFKWFVAGLLDGSLGFAGEESAGASFLRRDGTVWTTDKDGIIADLLAAEIVAVTGKDPGEAFVELAARFGTPHYTRLDAPATPAQKAALARLSPADVTATTLAGEPITAKLTRAPGNDAPIGGLKVIAGDGWFAARPSGTEDVYKIYAESLRSAEHLDTIVAEARDIVSRVCTAAAER